MCVRLGRPWSFNAMFCITPYAVRWRLLRDCLGEFVWSMMNLTLPCELVHVLSSVFLMGHDIRNVKLKCDYVEISQFLSLSGAIRFRIGWTQSAILWLTCKWWSFWHDGEVLEECFANSWSRWQATSWDPDELLVLWNFVVCEFFCLQKSLSNILEIIPSTVFVTAVIMAGVRMGFMVLLNVCVVTMIWMLCVTPSLL